MINQSATIQCDNFLHAMRLHSIALGLGLHSTYRPNGGTDDAHDTPITHTIGLLGEPQKINDFLRNYGQGYETTQFQVES